MNSPGMSVNVTLVRSLNHSCKSHPYPVRTCGPLIWPQLYLCKPLVSLPQGLPSCLQASIIPLLVHWLWNTISHHACLCPSWRSISRFACRNIQVPAPSRPQIPAESLCPPVPYPLGLFVAVTSCPGLGSAGFARNSFSTKPLQLCPDKYLQMGKPHKC